MISSSSFHCSLYAGCRSVMRPLLILSCIIFQINLPAAAAAKGTPVGGFFLDSTKEKKDDIKPLQIGDKVPDIEMQMMNYTSPTARLSDFKGKLVILDFWATWCGSCVEHFPENERLQKEFGDKIQILLVNTKNTRDNEKSIQSFLQKQKEIHGKGLTLPCVVNDSMMDLYFPHQFIPHYAWINKAGDVVAITASNSMTDENIQNLLVGKIFTMPAKNDKEMMEDFSKSFLLSSSGKTKAVKIFSAFTGELNLDISINQFHPTGNRLYDGVRLFNYPLTYFFQRAYPEMINVPYNRHVIEVSDSALFDMSANKATKKFCYELMTERKISIDTMMQKYLREDLYRSFHYRAHVEMRNVKCYVIINERENIKKKENLTASINKSSDDMSGKMLLSDLVITLNGWWKTPIVNEAIDSEHLANLTLPDNSDNLSELKKTLVTNGYNIKVENKLLSFFVITEEK